MAKSEVEQRCRCKEGSLDSKEAGGGVNPAGPPAVEAWSSVQCVRVCKILQWKDMGESKIPLVHNIFWITDTGT